MHGRGSNLLDDLQSDPAAPGWIWWFGNAGLPRLRRLILSRSVQNGGARQYLARMPEPLIIMVGEVRADPSRTVRSVGTRSELDWTAASRSANWIVRR